VKLKKVSSDVDVFKSSDSLLKIISAGGVKTNILGELLFSVSEGLLRKTTKNYSVKYWFVRGSGKDVVVFSASGEGVFENIIFGKLHIESDGVFWECVDERLSNLCDVVFNSLRRGYDVIKSRLSRSAVNDVIKVQSPSFVVSDVYASILDGFAEVTLSEAVLKYPVVFRTSTKLGDIISLEEFLEGLKVKYKSGKYVVSVLGRDWMFSIGVNLDSGEYTPSFVSWSTNERLLGVPALKKFYSLDPEEEVSLNVYAMSS